MCCDLTCLMNIDDVKRNAFAMPLTSPAFPPGPYRFKNREFLIVTYRTDLDALRAVVPEPLQGRVDRPGGAGTGAPCACTGRPAAGA